jgi:pyruvate,water dikinase
MICRIEDSFQQAVDIEWAFAGGQLHILQARPITTYVPLPPEMVTRPGQRRRLYGDIGLSGGMTINAPISPMGLDWMADGVRSIFEHYVGKTRQTLSMDESFWFFAGGRMYQNLSNMMWLASPQRMAKASELSDRLMARTLANIDVNQYRAPQRPPWARLRMLRFLPRVIWRLRRFFFNIGWCITAPQRARRSYQRAMDAFETKLTSNVDFDLPFDQFRNRYFKHVAQSVFEQSMPALAAYLFSVRLMNFLVGKRGINTNGDMLTEKLNLGLSGNVVAEMGMALYRMARLLDPSEFQDVARLAQRVDDRQVDTEFLAAWDAFLARYGWRGPLEMDVANPRYADDPQLALRQMSFMVVDDAGFDPIAAHQRRVAERHRAIEELMGRLGWFRRILVRRLHRVIDRFGGTRDTPKHQNLLLHYAVRQRALIEGERLARTGRLDAAEDVFDLTFEDLKAAEDDVEFDLRAVGAERTRFLKCLAANVADFPGVIDSRGRILRPAPEAEKPGELRGMAVSAGVVAGPVKVLQHPHDKPIDKGDVLVAYTTDPGWTPLFINAAAVVLEVGGVLQHGAVVAREYGKPCVVGVDRVTTKLRDGQQVEVDGTTGVIRMES